MLDEGHTPDHALLDRLCLATKGDGRRQADKQRYKDVLMQW
jgi:hypothetical protein